MSDTLATGLRGEHAAAEWLNTNGFELLHCNWREGRYELDIVARKATTVHFVEVKTRRRGSLTSPDEAITPAKFRSLSKAANAYIAHYDVQDEVQFDVIAVEYSHQDQTIRYIPNAMTPSW